jgi:hypothetical protein
MMAIETATVSSGAEFKDHRCSFGEIGQWKIACDRTFVLFSDILV